MKNKQNVAWSTFRYFVLAFLLCLSVVPLRGQPDAAVLSSPSADSLIIFSYPSRIRMFKTEYADNRLSLRKLKKRLRTFRKRQDTLYVQSYSGSWDDEKSNLRAAYWRANNLKGYLIDHYGLRERHFRTLNHPLAHPLWGEVVVVGCRGFQDCQSEIPQNRQEPASAARRQEQQEALPVALQGDKEPVDSSAVAATAVVPDAATAPVAPDAATALSTSVASSASVTPSSSTASTSTATSPSLPANGRYLGVKTNLGGHDYERGGGSAGRQASFRRVADIVVSVAHQRQTCREDLHPATRSPLLALEARLGTFLRSSCPRRLVQCEVESRPLSRRRPSVAGRGRQLWCLSMHIGQANLPSARVMPTPGTIPIII